MKDNIKLPAQAGQAPGTWDISVLLNTGSWGNWLTSTFQSTAITELVVLNLTLFIKFLLFFY